MCARAHAAALYTDDATMLHMDHTGSFKIPGATRHFCLRACPHMHGPGTRKCQPCCVAESLHTELHQPIELSWFLAIMMPDSPCLHTERIISLI